MTDARYAMSQRLAGAAYGQRQKEKGWLRANLVLSPEDTASLGALMAAWGCSRQEAVRRAVRIAASSAHCNHKE